MTPSELQSTITSFKAEREGLSGNIKWEVVSGLSVCVCVCTCGCVSQWKRGGAPQTTYLLTLLFLFPVFFSWLNAFLRSLKKTFFQLWHFLAFSNPWVFPNRSSIECYSERWRCLFTTFHSRSQPNTHWLSDITLISPSWIASGRKHTLNVMYYETAVSIKWSVCSLNPLLMEMHNV